ncbi:MAG: class 1b ribonucleoside-diphosphate reductase subunit alpha, partial [Bavariicoccus seileri]
MTKDYFILNNMLNVLVEEQIPLHYDREALEEYLNTEIRDNLKTFVSIDEKLDYLISHDYIDESVLSIYGENNREFVKKLFIFAYNYGFKLKSFMAAYKFYNQYAMKTND